MSKAKTKESATVEGESGDEGVSMLVMLARELSEESSGELGVVEGTETESSKTFLACWTVW